MQRAMNNQKAVIDTVPLRLRYLLPTAAVYGHVIHNCLELSETTALEIEREWSLSGSAITRLAIRSCPSKILNLIVSADCAQKFGGDLLAQVEGFYSYDRQGSLCDCSEWRDDCVCHLKSWRMDLDPSLCLRGFIVPQRHPSSLWIESLLVFRNAKDRRPFRVRFRKEKAA